MNERFKELALQAGCKVMDDGDWYIPSATGLEKIVYTNGVGLEKFAELIVRECAMFIVVALEGRVGSLIADTTANSLEEHFGVE